MVSCVFVSRYVSNAFNLLISNPYFVTILDDDITLRSIFEYSGILTRNFVTIIKLLLLILKLIKYICYYNLQFLVD